MASITLKGVSKRFETFEALRPLDLRIEDGEFFTLLGPSGCGKTTLLRMLAGLETPSSGSIFIDAKDVTRLAPKDRDLALVFQDYALYPHMTVRQNLAFPLQARRLGKEAIARTVSEIANRLQLTTLLDRRPKQLSGGQQQRVALGRAMVRNPKAFLMDEPLSNLDAKLRVDMRVELKRLQRDLGITTIYVTHDQEEAMTMSDRIAVMRDGVVQQCASPVDIYRRPTNRWVASFVGSPAMNFLEADVVAEGGAGALVPKADPSVRFPIPSPPCTGAVTVGVRPEHVSIRRQPTAAVLRGRVHVVELVGDHFIVVVKTECGLITVKTGDEEVPREEAEVFVDFDTRRVHLFAPETGERVGP